MLHATIPEEQEEEEEEEKEQEQYTWLVASDLILIRHRLSGPEK